LYNVGVIVAIHHLTQLCTLTTLRCNIVGEVDACRLHVVGFSHSRTERSISTGGKNLASLRTTARKHPTGGRLSLPVRQPTATTEASVSGISDRLFFLLGFFPAPGSSYFFTFSADASDSLSMEHNDPMHIDTQDPNCSAVLPQGAVAFCGTTAGTLIRWNIR